VSDKNWPKRKHALFPASTYGPDIVYHNDYVLKLECRYAIAVEALIKVMTRSTGTNFTLARTALEQCPPLPKEVERE
jgi:hypothetical protein